MSGSDRVRGGQLPGPEPSPMSKSTTGADPYADWLERMQRARVRHAAITKNLQSWSNYKTWADRIKDSWEEESKEPKT
jgi:hypothetical protein